MNNSTPEFDEIEGPEDGVSPSESAFDIKQLNKLGYGQELLRGMNALMSFSISFTVCAIIPGIGQLYNYGLSTGGPVVMIWGWLIASVGSLATGLCLAEICSTYPQAGSVYYWTAQLLPEEWAPLGSFFCGWINLIGNVANSASFASGCVTIIAGAFSMYSGYIPSVGIQVMMSIFLITIWGLQNLISVDKQGWIDITGAMIQVFGSLVILVVCLAMSPTKESTSFVFFSSYNSTGINNMGYVSCIGLLMALYCYGGFEAGAHMAEETRNASKVAPWGIIQSCLVSFFSGIFLLLGLLYCTPSNSNAMALGYQSGIDFLLSQPNLCNNSTDCIQPNPNGPGSSKQALVNLFWYSSGRIGGLLLTLILAILVYSSGTSSLTATSRIIFAMARDKALPFSAQLRYISPSTKSPLKAVLLVAVVDSLLLLLPLGNSTAFQQITSISSVGYQISYGIPILLKLTIGKHTFKQDIFHLGRWSQVLGWLSVLWCFATSVVLFLPQQYPVEASNMNFSCVIVVGSLLFAFLYWIFWARHIFEGPKREESSCI